MFPFFEIFGGITLYTFGITLSIIFFVFLWNLKRLETRFGYSFTFFSQNIIWFFLSSFVFSRIFYLLGNWKDLKYINEPFHFLIMSEYNFSLFWAMTGFFIALYVLVKIEKTTIRKYIDGVVLAFLFILIIGYIWALLWGQVYGRPTDFWIEITYTNSSTLVPYQVGVFPLPIVYMILSFLLFCGMYILSLFIHIKGFIGYCGIIAFSAIVLICEFFSGKEDILSVYSIFNLPQVYAIIFALAAWYQLYKIFETESLSKRI